MIDVKRLTKSQRMTLETMKHFDCKGICCEDCPLNRMYDCGSEVAKNILKRYRKETKQ